MSFRKTILSLGILCLLHGANAEVAVLNLDDAQFQLGIAGEYEPLVTNRPVFFKVSFHCELADAVRLTMMLLLFCFSLPPRLGPVFRGYYVLCT